jgi:hypothetical protein
MHVSNDAIKVSGSREILFVQDITYLNMPRGLVRISVFMKMQRGTAHSRRTVMMTTKGTYLKVSNGWWDDAVNVHNFGPD